MVHKFWALLMRKLETKTIKYANAEFCNGNIAILICPFLVNNRFVQEY